jgi:hypothetical protein
MSCRLMHPPMRRLRHVGDGKVTKERTDEENYRTPLNEAGALSSRASDPEMDVVVPAGSWAPGRLPGNWVHRVHR